MDTPHRPAVETPEAADRLLGQLATLFTSPELFPVTVDLESDRMGFVPVEPEAQAALPFHSVELLRASTPEALQLPLSYLLRRFAQVRPPSDPLHFILHHAFCGSTLLSRALAAVTTSRAHREPDVLHAALKAVAEARGQPGRAPRAAETLSLVLQLLARHGAEETATVVKTSDSASLALDALFLTRPESRGVFLYTSPETFAASALRSADRRAWLRKRAVWFERGLLSLPAGAEPPHEDAPPGRIAVALWASHVASLRRAAREVGGARLRTLSTEALLEDLDVAVDATRRFFQLEGRPHPQRVLASLTDTHAKSGRPYDRSLRARELAELRERHAQEIDDALTWARGAMGGSALDEPLPFPLLA